MYKGYTSGVSDGKIEERRKIIGILLDGANFSWIENTDHSLKVGTQLISEIIRKITKEDSK